ncbi:uncharacterized protein si:dkeyp-72g9.4 [Mugil cephalus]|uniref:uncharacterized protein si:dkeyp-72g9.4 n=1 Tax=Mugil cephalus TaxID=48193 RepID=UPI001FB73536|nr:uncharacterized protein si:dkeyp-72g9.4 [Mugil cephalus]
MRPRSRLLSKRRLMLPTIREGSEETVRDLNEANTLHTAGHSQAVSSEDYLLSICHLAHPTFPSRDVSADGFPARQQDAVQQRQRSPRLSGTALTASGFNPKEEAQASAVQRSEGKELSGELTFGNSDPLEYLYGHQNNLSAFSGGVGKAFVEGRLVRRHGILWESQGLARAHSIPRASSPDFPRHRKSSCPELQCAAGSSVSNISPKRSPSRSEAGRVRQADRGAEGERLKPTIKQSFISQWISECRSAWKEARVRACMLPAIAEI